MCHSREIRRAEKNFHMCRLPYLTAPTLLSCRFADQEAGTDVCCCCRWWFLGNLGHWTRHGITLEACIWYRIVLIRMWLSQQLNLKQSWLLGYLKSPYSTSANDFPCPPLPSAVFSICVLPYLNLTWRQASVLSNLLFAKPPLHHALLWKATERKHRGPLRIQLPWHHWRKENSRLSSMNDAVLPPCGGKMHIHSIYNMARQILKIKDSL